MNRSNRMKVTITKLAVACAVSIGLVVVYAESNKASDSTSVATSTEEAASFLTKLGLIRGHLLAGIELYRNDLPAMAETHMKHPQDEIYSELLEYFERFGCSGFADELTDLTNAVVSQHSVALIEEKHGLVSSAISNCEPQRFTSEPAVINQVIVRLLSNVKEEFEIGVNTEGQVVDKHEYQDAWGFTQVALGYAVSDELASALNDAARDEYQQLFSSLQQHWPSLNEDQLESVDLSALSDFLANRESD